MISHASTGRRIFPQGIEPAIDAGWGPSRIASIANMDENHFLCVGLVCLDIINEVNSYPKEDSDIRCISQRWQRGGNASNNCSILASLRGSAHFCGIIADSQERRFIEDDFSDYGIDYSSAPVVKGIDCPNSCVILSLATGSRTIFHSNKSRREVTLEEFCQLDLTKFTWIHFEGRNLPVVKEMILYVRELNKTRSKPIIISVEIEKAREGLDELIPMGDYVFVSKEYALFRGWNNITEALENISTFMMKSATAICPWGDQGAGAVVAPHGPILKCPAFSPEQVLDTLGAGDTFIGSSIFALASGNSVDESIRFGCEVAGFKIQFRGWLEFRSKVLELECVKNISKKNMT